MTQRESSSKKASVPLPKNTKVGANWPGKIATAKQARKDGQEARKGKPATFGWDHLKFHT